MVEKWRKTWILGKWDVGTGIVTSSFLFVVMPGATSSVLAPSRNALVPRKENVGMPVSKSLKTKDLAVSYSFFTH